ncbi:hypothetical protein INTERNEXUS_280 [Bacillus phage vB_BspM_Internexus]|nr:hypothetical protein INTERNEXUS_280 [Bacillus phage vB_BspM_Internexus]
MDLTTDFLISLNEENIFLMNLINEMNLDEKNLIIKHHNNLINENTELLNEGLSNGLKKIIKKLSELIQRIKEWINTQLKKFASKLAKKTSELEKKIHESDFTSGKKVTIEIDPDKILKTISSFSDDPYYKKLMDSHNRMSTITDPSQFSILKTSMDVSLDGLSRSIGEKLDNKSSSSYTTKDIDKLLTFLKLSYKNIAEVEGTMKELKDNLSVIKERISRMDNYELSYLIGSSSIHVHSELIKLNSKILASLSKVVSSINGAIISMVN